MQNNDQQDNTLQKQAMPPQIIKKLMLNKETIRELTDTELESAAGGTHSSVIVTIISVLAHVCISSLSA